MISEHASESDIQMYALTPDAVTATTAAHIEQCDHCRDTVASYQFIFGEIKEAPRPSFDFDLSSLVLQQVPLHESSSSRGSLPVWLWLSISFLVAIPLYVFRENLAELFKGISIFLFCSLV